MLVILSMSVFAEGELEEPGILPNSPFYFVDKTFDVFQSVEAKANERAAEAIEMASENHQKGLEKALAGYEKTMEKRALKAAEDPEEVAQQGADHLVGLARAQEKANENAQAALQKALDRSAQNMDKGLKELEKSNAGKAEEILAGVLAKAPEAAHKGLTNALEAVGRRGPPADKGKPADAGMPENKGKPDSPGKSGESQDSEEEDVEVETESEEESE